MKLSKKSNLIIINIFCLVLVILFLPDFSKEEATQEEVVEPIAPEYEYLIEFIQKETEKTTAALTYYTDFLDYYLEQLNEQQLQHFVASLITYELKVNDHYYHVGDIYLKDSDTFTLSIKQTVSPYIMDTDHKEVNKIVKDLLKDDTFEEIELVTKHSLKSKTTKEDTYAEFVLSGDMEKLKETNNKIIFELSPSLQEKLNVSTNVINMDLTNVTNFKESTDLLENHPTYLSYVQLMNNIYNLQKALYHSIATFEDKESIIPYLDQTSQYTVHLTDSSQYTDEIKETMLVSNRPNLTIAVENPLFLAMTEDILNEIYKKTNEKYYVSSENILHMTDLQEVNYAPYFTISNRLSVDTSTTIELSDALQQLVKTSQITFNYNPIKLDNLNVYDQTIYTDFNQMEDYEQQDIAIGLTNLRKYELALVESKKLFNYIYSTVTKEQQLEMLQSLFNQSIILNGYPYQELNSNVSLDIYGFHLIQEQRLSEILLENKSYYEALSLQLLSNEDFKEITLLSNHPIYKTEFIQPSRSYLKFSTKDSHALINEEKIQFKLSDKLKNHYGFVSSDIRLQPSLNNYYGSPFHMGSLNSRLNQDIIMRDGLYMQTEFEFLQSALQPLLTTEHDETLIDYIHAQSKITKLTLESDSEVHDLAQKEINVNRGIQFTIHIDNPLLDILPFETANTYLNDYFLASEFIQFDKQPINYYLSTGQDYLDNNGFSKINAYLNESDIPLTITFSDHLIEILDLPHGEITLYLK